MRSDLEKLFENTLSGDPKVIKDAEAHLKEVSKHTDFTIEVLRITRVENAGARQAAAIFFKNIVRNRWDAPSPEGINEDTRQMIRNDIFPLMLCTSPTVQVQLREALVLIAYTDFPREWPALLPEIVQCLRTQDLERKVISMETAHAILKKYRHAERSNDVLFEVKGILDIIQEPLLEVVLASQQRVNILQSMPLQDVENWFRLFLAACEVFYSFHKVDIPEFFEDHKGEFFKTFLTVLGLNEWGSLGDEGASILRKCKARILQSLTLYAVRYTEELQEMVVPCVEQTHRLLSSLTLEDKDDMVAACGMQFMSAACQTQWEEISPFNNVAVIESICRTVIVQNSRLRVSDVDMFEDDPLEFMRLDAEGADDNTRRQTAMELVYGLGKLYKDKVTAILLDYVKDLMRSAGEARNQKNFLEEQICKDAAVYLFTAVAIKASTRTRGVTQVNDNVDVISFFKVHLLSDLVASVEKQQGSNRYLARAAALKYVQTFRNQFTDDLIVQLLPVIVDHLKCSDPVVHSYAANLLERLLTARLPVEVDGVRVFAGPLRLRGMPETREALLGALPILGKWMCGSDSAIVQNEYVSRVLTRVLATLDVGIGQQLEPTLRGLTDTMKVVAANPSNPHFTHYLFESLAILAKAGGKQTVETTKVVANVLLEPLVHLITVGETHDFAPYCFQILSILVENCREVAAANGKVLYDMFEHIMAQERWTVTQANVPAIVQLLSSYFRRHRELSQFIDISQRTEQILERFQYCLMHKRLVFPTAFEFLNNVLMLLPFRFYSKYAVDLIKVILSRLQAAKTDKLSQAVVVSFSLYVVQLEHQCGDCRDVLGLPAILEQIQPGLMSNFMRFIFLPSTKNLTKLEDRKLCIVALSYMLMSKSIALNTEVSQEIFSVISEISGLVVEKVSREERNKELEQELEEARSEQVSARETVEFDGNFNKLDCVKSVVCVDKENCYGDVRSILRTNLTSLAQQHTGLVKQYAQQLMTALSLSA